MESFLFVVCFMLCFVVLLLQSVFVLRDALSIAHPGWRRFGSVQIVFFHFCFSFCYDCRLFDYDEKNYIEELIDPHFQRDSSRNTGLYNTDI